MKRSLFAALLALAAAGTLEAFPAVEGLIQRRLPGHAGQIVLKDLPAPAPGGAEVFAYETRDGKLVLEGNTPVAQSAALGEYLRNVAHVVASWEGFEAERLPKTLPAVGKRTEQTIPFSRRVYFNYCTLSYSCAFWDWKRWEYEIDLMALRGINLPLQPIGLEAVWYNLLQRPEVGFTELEARSFLVGPAFFAWQWMTNIEGFGGPLPKAYIDSHIRLGRQIVERERAFGMTPIQQGFTGFVPILMKTKFPKANIRQQWPWCGSFRGSAQLDPLDPLFKKLAKLFYEEQKTLFGAYGYYGTDPFHESAPPRPGNQYLSDVGKTIYEAAVASDPKATLCMQSWSIRMPILKSIPKEHALVLDIGGRWRGTRAFEGYPFVIGTIHNFGGRSSAFGNLRGIAGNSFGATKKAAGNCVGCGVFPEGIETNPAVYDLIFETFLTQEPIDFGGWLDRFVKGRYGADDPHAKKAWELLTENSGGLYGKNSRPYSSLIAANPALNLQHADPNWDVHYPYHVGRLLTAWEELQKVAPEVRKTCGYRFDLADIGRQILSAWLTVLHTDVGNAYLDGDADRLRSACDRFIAAARDMDALCSTERLLSFRRWVREARAMEGTEADRDLYDFNASCQVTQWGNNIRRPRIFNYAWKEWGGLIGDYYIPRWQQFHQALAEALKKGTPWRDETTLPNQDYRRATRDSSPFHREMFDWETKWIRTPHTGYASDTEGDPVAVSARILKTWGREMHASFEVNPGERLGLLRKRIVAARPVSGTPVVFRWTPKHCGNDWRTVEFDVTKYITVGGKYSFVFDYERGGARLDIAELTLLQNGLPVSTDCHEGTTGDRDDKNTYTVVHTDPIIGATFRLRAKIRKDGRLDSYGSVRLVR